MVVLGLSNGMVLQKHKCVPLEDLAAEFKLRTQVRPLHSLLPHPPSALLCHIENVQEFSSIDKQAD